LAAEAADEASDVCTGGAGAGWLADALADEALLSPICTVISLPPAFTVMLLDSLGSSGAGASVGTGVAAGFFVGTVVLATATFGFLTSRSTCCAGDA